MAVINLTTKYSKRIDERFKLKSVTDAYAGEDVYKRQTYMCITKNIII